MFLTQERKSYPVAQLGGGYAPKPARAGKGVSLPEYADGTLYIVQEAPWDDYDLSASAKITRFHRDDVVAPKLITMPNGISNSRI